MPQILNQLLQFLQLGIATIFMFIQLLWMWSVTQVSTLTHVPWQSWPLWKQVLLAIVVGGVAFALFRVARELWGAGERTFSAFGALLGVLVRTLPAVVVAGLMSLGGLWVLNNVDLSAIRLPSIMGTSGPEAENPPVVVDLR